MESHCIKAGNEQAIQDMFLPFKLERPVADNYIFTSISIEKGRIVVSVEKETTKHEMFILPSKSPQTDANANLIDIQFANNSKNNKSLLLLAKRAKLSKFSPFVECVPFGRKAEFKVSKKFVAEHIRKNQKVHLTASILFFVLFISLMLLSWRLDKHHLTILSRLFLVLSSIIFILFALEISLRSTLMLWASDMPLGTNCYISNPRGYFKETTVDNYPDIKAYCVEGRERAHHECEQKTGKSLILALGDSFTRGVGVFHEDSWPKQLQAIINRQNSTESFVTNCGKGGSDVLQAIERYDEFGQKHSAEIIIYAFVLNDITFTQLDKYSKQAHDISFQVQYSENNKHIQTDNKQQILSRHSAIVRFFTERLARMHVAESTLHSYLSTYSSPPPDNVTITFDQLLQLKEKAKQNKSRFLVAIWPLIFNLQDYPLTFAHQLIVSELEKRGIETLDMLPEFVTKNTEDLQVHHTDLHPNEKAQQIAAELIYQRLTKLGWIDQP